MSDTWIMGALAAQDAYNPEEGLRQREARDAADVYRGVPRLDPGIRREPGATQMLPAAETFGQVVGDLVIPQTPSDFAMMTLSAPARVLGKAAKMGAIAAGYSLDSDEAQAAPARAAKKVLGSLFKSGETDVPFVSRYISDPVRAANPSVYKRPDVIAREAAENVAPEHPALRELFGVTRDDLYGISQQGRRQGNVEPSVWQPTKAGGKVNYAAEKIMTPQNAQRLVDTLAEAQKYPELIKGMDPWYVMDPAFKRMEQLVGREQAIKDYNRFNYMTAPFSAGSDVLTELNRGTAAHMMAVRGDYPTFQKYAGMAEKLPKNAKPGQVSRETLGAAFPDELRDVVGHAYHGVQHKPVERWMRTGEHGYDKDTVKIPLYTQASGVPETGFQTRLPVPDAHFTRAVGMPDVRLTKTFNDYMGGTEYRPVGPWFRENVAKPLGIEAVPAQARMWGTYAPQTGVDTPVGAGKLELLAQRIWERAKKLDVDPKKLRDDVLTGKAHAAWLPGALLAPGVMGAIASQDQYEQ